MLRYKQSQSGERLLQMAPGAGLAGLKVTTLDKLKKALPGLEEEVASDPDAFQDFYMFAFRFCLTVSLAAMLVCWYYITWGVVWSLLATS